jgi:hypothetical protein
MSDVTRIPTFFLRKKKSTVFSRKNLWKPPYGNGVFDTNPGIACISGKHISNKCSFISKRRYHKAVCTNLSHAQKKGKKVDFFCVVSRAIMFHE